MKKKNIYPSDQKYICPERKDEGDNKIKINNNNSKNSLAVKLQNEKVAKSQCQ